MIAAFFDIDGTLFRNSLLIEHFKELVKYKFLNETYWINTVKDKYEKWEKRNGDFEDYLDELVEMYVEGIKDIDPKSIDFIAQRVIDLKGDKVYFYTKKKLEEHLMRGDKVIIISGSPSFLVEKMAKKYNVNDYKGTVYIIKDGKYNGEKKPMWDSKSKNKAIEEYVKKYNIDLEKSFAYGDTTGDISMFKRVGNPVAINPAARLLEYIKNDDKLREKINIVIERKNVVYKFKGTNIDEIDIITF